jgi:hypothetical protein
MKIKLARTVSSEDRNVATANISQVVKLDIASTIAQNSATSPQISFAESVGTLAIWQEIARIDNVVPTCAIMCQEAPTAHNADWVLEMLLIERWRYVSLVQCETDHC